MTLLIEIRKVLSKGQERNAKMGKIEFREANELVSALQNDISEIILSWGEEKSSLSKVKLCEMELIKEVIFAGNEISFYGGNKLIYDSLRNAERRGLRRLASIIEDKMEDYNYEEVRNMLIVK